MDEQWPKAEDVNGLFKECMQLDRLERAQGMIWKITLEKVKD